MKKGHNLLENSHKSQFSNIMNDKKGHKIVNNSFAHKSHDWLVLDGTNGMKYELLRLALKRIYNGTTLSNEIVNGLH